MNILDGQGGQTFIGSASIAVPGLVTQRGLTKSVINLMGASAQVITITLGTPIPSNVYSLSIAGASVSFLTSSTVTAAGLQSLLVDRLSVLPQVSGNFKIDLISTTDVKLTALTVGLDAVVAVAAPLTLTNVTSAMASRVPFGRILAGSATFLDGLQLAGLPLSATDKVLGVTQFSHGMFRDLGGPDGFIHGDVMSLVKSGVLWVEFNAMVPNPAPAGSALYYKSIKLSPTDRAAGQLYYGTAPTSDYTLLPGVSSLDSETTTIADGRVVGLISLSV
mgnify:FL=1